MNKKTQQVYRIILGAAIIVGSIFLSFRYLMKGSPFFKALAIGFIVAVAYLVINYLNKKAKEDHE